MVCVIDPKKAQPHESVFVEFTSSRQNLCKGPKNEGQLPFTDQTYAATCQPFPFSTELRGCGQQGVCLSVIGRLWRVRFLFGCGPLGDDCVIVWARTKPGRRGQVGLPASQVPHPEHLGFPKTCSVLGVPFSWGQPLAGTDMVPVIASRPLTTRLCDLCDDACIRARR
jgi:hypothetical protein